MDNTDFSSWLDATFSILEDNQLESVAAVLYGIWNAKNDALWNSKLPLPHTAWHSAFGALSSWRTATQCSKSSSHPMPPVASQQQIMEPSCYIDAGYDPQSGKATFRALIFSTTWEFITATNGPLSHCTSPLMAETMACKEALT